MKRIYLFISVLSSLICSQNNKLLAQDKQTDFKLPSGGIVYNVAPCGDDDFFVVYGKQLLSKQAKKDVMKFDKNLQPIWKNPITITGASIGGVDFYSYTNPTDNTTISYLFGAEQFLQALPDGTTKAKKTDIPPKELENIAAVFTDLNGLNIITLNGDKKFPSGNMNWYVFSHDQLNKTKKNIILPLPSKIDKENDYSISYWRLNEVTPNGLYFTYVNYKNTIKETDRSILSCYIIKIDKSGKAGDMITIDLNKNRYNILPINYVQNTPDLKVFPKNPMYYDSNLNGSYFYYDNAFMDIEVDEKNNRIYTIIAINDEFKTNKYGLGDNTHDLPIQSFEVNIFDLAGKKINQSTLDYKATKLKGNDDWGYIANLVSLSFLKNEEGLTCKAINNGNGNIYVLNKDGKVEKQNKFGLFTYEQMTAHFYKDVYANSTYTTMKDFENSPYMNIKSPEVQFFNKMDKNAKPTILYLSLKSGNIFAAWDSKNDLVKLAFFSK